MPQFTFEAPDGQRHTIEGPEGATAAEAFQTLQGHLASQGINKGQAPVKQSSYQDQLSDALNHAVKALAPSWNHNDSSYSPYKPMQAGKLPNDAIDPVGNDTQMTAALGGGSGLAARIAAGAMGASRAAPSGPPPLPANINQMPTQQSFGQQMAQNVGQAPAQAIPRGPPSAPPPLPGAAANPGPALQNQLLEKALGWGAGAVGHAVGGPVVGALAHKFAPQVLRLMK